MAVDYFLKIDQIKGESQDKAHKDEIELNSFSWGAANAGSFSSAGGGGGAGKVALQDFNFVMRQNKASPLLFDACCSGKHIKTAVLIGRKAGTTQVEYLKVTLTDLLVTSYTTGGTAGSPVPDESISLAYSKIEVEYKEQLGTGLLGSPIKAGWNVKTNTAV